MDDMRAFPGGDLIKQGFEDLARGLETPAALLVSIGRSRLVRLGYEVSGALKDPEKQLYLSLVEMHKDAAHSRYNALIRRLVSFERAAACAR